MGRRLGGKRPSPATVISIVALVFAVTGTAVASVATVSVLSKKEKKQTRNIADAEIGKAAPGLSVKHADSAGAVADGSVTRSKLAPGVLATCPSGMTLVGAAHDLCVDSTTRETVANWAEALAICRQAGLRLPSIAESQEASDVLVGTGNYWTDEIFDDTGAASPARGWVYRAAIDTIEADARSSFWMVRCVATPSDA
jgi:hypothetical protein